MSDIPAHLSSKLSVIDKAQTALTKSNSRLDNAVANSGVNGLPTIAIGPAQGAYLSILCQLLNAKSVLEIGTLGGYSTIWFAQSVPGISVTSIEFNNKHHAVALENCKGLDNVDIILGAALDVLPQLAEQGIIFDFVFIDADWDEQAQYFDWAVKLTRSKGCIYVDNAVRQLTEVEDGDETKAWALIEQLKGDERVEATLMPTLAPYKTTLSSVVDGFVMAIKK